MVKQVHNDRMRNSINANVYYVYNADVYDLFRYQIIHAKKSQFIWPQHPGTDISFFLVNFFSLLTYLKYHAKKVQCVSAVLNVMCLKG